MIHGDERDSFRVGAYRGIPIFLHWTWVVGAIAVVFIHSFDLVGAFALVIAMTFVVFVHELGHAALARAYRERVLAITFYAWGGECRFSDTHLEPLPRSVIAWGGALAQAALFSATRLIVGARSSFDNSLLDAVVWAFLVMNVGMIAFNLLPIRPFDGHQAWQIPLHAYRHFRAQRAAKAALAKVRRKGHLRLVRKDDV